MKSSSRFPWEPLAARMSGWTIKPNCPGTSWHKLLLTSQEAREQTTHSIASLLLLPSVSLPWCHAIAHRASILDKFPASACHPSLPGPAPHTDWALKKTVDLNTSPHLVISVFQTFSIFSSNISSVREHWGDGPHVRSCVCLYGQHPLCIGHLPGHGHGGYGCTEAQTLSPFSTQ